MWDRLRSAMQEVQPYRSALRRVLLATPLLLAVACGSSGTTGGTLDAAGHGDGSTEKDSGTPKDAARDAHTHDGGDAAKDASRDALLDAARLDGTSDALGDVTPPVEATTQAWPDASVVDGSTVLNCTGRCGPVLDPCTGTTTLCGGCAPGVGPDGGVQARVCDLTTNTCGAVETTCADFNAQCGTVVTSCGSFLDCPDTTTKGCAAGEQCNAETNQCEACQPVTCLDLGYECGSAWLGCGPDISSNYTDCGTCGASQICNVAFNVCEPTCVPGTPASICTAAGAQCGIISNGCGGTVDCDSVMGFGCPTGQGCGLQGQANKCDPAPTPVECVALGQNCGSIKSVCTGLTIDCGQCPMGQVCNPNGVCGPPCTPKTCAEFSDIECGTFPDGCGSTVACGTCPGGVCNDTTHICCTEKTCAASYADQCGTALPNGCGTNSVTCPCPGGDTCEATGGTGAPPNGTPGTCCTPTKTAATYGAAGQCGTNLANGCGTNNIDVTCPNGGECVGTAGAAPGNGVVGTCCAPPTCAGVATGACESIPDTCLTANKIACNKCVAPKTCLNGDECCTPAVCAANSCNVTATSPDCGASIACGCAAGADCLCGGLPCGMGVTGTCTPILTCASYPNECGTGLSNGVGGTINCGCGNGKVCTTSTPGMTGTCQCATPSGMAYTCATVPGGPGMAGGAQCGTFNNGCGGSISCTCAGAGETCDTAVMPAACCTPNACPAGPGVGTACGSSSNGCGGTKTCGCGAGETCDTNVCCAPTSCPASPHVGTACGKITNGCGGTNTCSCGAGETCDTATSLCCAPTACPANPGVGSPCGSVSNSCGGTNTCSCPSGAGNENFTCTAGACACVPETCDGRSGVVPDGCGGTIPCQS